VGWEKYEPVEFIGEGGMGRVYKVFDPVLRRHLALKFIRDEDDRLIRRFFREAQSQARIDHEFVCKVYDVGEVEGLPYIAMQYIDGKSLKEAAHQLTLDQKVTIVRQVALALYAAHRMGIIHRDIKPSNIMVEQRDDGSYHPYVMDFGLAREIADAGETATGVIEGTPSFMAPEQARGDHKNLDRRVDIYSLGATLYQLIAERPPFIGDSSLSVLLALDKEEATPLRAIVPTLPEDLEIIVMKCLEKDAGQRYDSAKALADDLERYLNGDPIAARRAGLAYVLLKKIRKHKALFAVSCAGAIGVSIAGGAAARARMLAAEQSELSQQLGKDVKEMELLLRWAYALPLHDVGREKARIRDRMQEIERRIEKMGEIGAGPGHYALGRGHLALRDPERARDHLEKALSAGYGGPEVEGALGRALGELYKKELEKTYRIGDKKPRDERREVIARELLAPALQHLKAGGGEELESEAYMEGLIAFYNKQYPEALEKARLAEERALSTYEAKKLRGDVFAAIGTEKKEQGEGEDALADYDKAAEAYEGARAIARSDGAVYEAECEMWAQRMNTEFNLGKSPKASFEKAQAACEGALVANPESGAAHGKKAWVLSQYGGHLLWTEGKDPTAVFSQAVLAGKTAVRLDPQDANTYDAMGISHLFLGFYEMRQGKDPRPLFRLAAEDLERAIEVHPNFEWAYNDLGVVHKSFGEYELSRGLDPMESLNKSVIYKKKAIELNPSYYFPYTNAAMAYVLRAQYELGTGRDPSESLKLAVEFCERSLKISKSYYTTYNILGAAYRLEAKHRLHRGEAYDESIKKALKWLSAELEVNPTSYGAHLEIASSYHFVAYDRLSRGEDPRVPLEQAEAALREMEKTGAEELPTPLTRAKTALLKARLAAGAKNTKDADAAWQEAETAIETALTKGVGVWEVFATGAEISFWRARDVHGRKKPASDLIQRGLERADKGLAISPEEPVLLLWKGALLLLMSRTERGPNSGDAERRGKSLMDDALRKNSFLERERKLIQAAIAAE
jgi:serine/threonine-protein kinase